LPTVTNSDKSSRPPGAPKPPRIDRAALRRLGVGIPLMTCSLLLLVILFFVTLGAAKPDSPGTEVPLSTLLADARAGKVKAATVLDHDARVGAVVDGRKVWAAYPKSDVSTDALLRDLQTGGAQVEVDQQSGKAQAVFLAQFVFPLLLLANLFGLLFVAGRSGGARDLALFSKLLNRKKDGTGPGQVTFNNVAGAASAVVELREIVEYLRDPTLYAALGALPPKGVLLVGPPGCGKTLLARAVAGEANVPFFSISGSEFVESLVGVGAARVRDLFRQALAAAPAIVFIDELDAAGRRRGAGVGGGHDEREQTLNELLVQMDGFEPSAGVVVLGATNRPDILDPALVRPGRFDRKVTIDLPDVSGREQILRLHAQNKKVAPDVDLSVVARRTPGFSGADLANLLNEAALLAVRARRTALTSEEVTEAAERVLAGPQATGHRLSPEELDRIAVHEAGHAIVATSRRGPGSVEKVTITSRGRHVGHLEVLQRDDRVVIGRSSLLDELTIAMAGVASEEMVFGEPSTAAEGDLERATELARRIVGRYGMSDSVGRIQVLEREEEVFLGRDYLATQHVASTTLEQVDAEVRQLLDAAEREATQVLKAHRKRLDALADALVEHEVLEGPDLESLLALPAPKAPRAARGAN
jgi:cell division protease FtsH